ncbi:hypothetical protein BH10PLA1_BH10PLA1_05000 [soil metagenome]
MNVVITTYQKLIRFGIFIGPIVLLLIRLAWGFELAQSGYGHLTHLDKTTKFFEELNIPMAHANAVLSGTMELVGGWAWMLGFGTRLISIPVFINFCVAIATAGKDGVQALLGKPEWDPTKVIDDAAFPFLVMSLVLIAFGPGLFSVDAILKKLFFNKRTGKGKVAATTKAEDWMR